MAKEKAPKVGADDFDKILSKLESTYGEGTLYNSEEASLRDVRIQFEAPRLTWAYGGGFKLNAIHRFNGKESGGKTTLCTYIAGQCQKHKYKETGSWKNSHVVVLDNERSFEMPHARDLGLQLYDEDGKPLVHVLRNLYVEDQCAAWEQMVVSGRICCTIYDSDAAAINKTEFNNEIGKACVAPETKVMFEVV